MRLLKISCALALVAGMLSFVGCTGLSLNTGASSRADIEAMIKSATGATSGGGTVTVNRDEKTGILKIEAGGGSAQASADTKAAAEAAAKAAAEAEAIYKQVQAITFWVILACVAALVLNIAEVVKFVARLWTQTGL